MLHGYMEIANDESMCGVQNFEKVKDHAGDERLHVKPA